MTQEQKVSIENVVEDVEEPTTSVAAASAIAAAASGNQGNQGNGMSIAAASAAAQGISQSVFQKQQSAAEKKARKAMQKKGLEQVTGIASISVIRKKAPMFSINAPDVYKNASSDTWIIFGEARVENYGNRSLNPGAQRAALNAAAAAAAGGSDAVPSAANTSIETEPVPVPAAVSAEDVDESGLESKDIELVMSQAGCDRSSAVKALNGNGKDVVNAIMELTA